VKHRRLSNITISVKLIILIVIVAIAFSALFVLSRTALSRVSSALDTMQSVHASALRLAQTQSLKVYEAQVALYKAINYGSQYYAASEIEAEVVAAKDALKEAMSIVAELADFPGLGEAELQAVLASQEALDRYSRYSRNTLGFIEDSAALALSTMPELEAQFNLMVESLEALNQELAKAGTQANESAQAEASRLVATLLIVGLVTVGVIVLFSFIIARSITVPIQALMRTLETLSQGEFRYNVDVSGDDEMGMMGGSVDRLIERMKSLIGTVKDKVVALEETGQELASNMEETASAVIEINSNIGSTKAQLGEQSDSVGEVSAAIEQLAHNIVSLSELIGRQSQVVVQSSAAVEQMIANVESVAQASSVAASASDELILAGNDGKQRIDEVGESVRDIVRDSESLSEAADIIAQIASRTNLLAMNAAIEAAHAGDSGKGFAVVADEIRKLAEQSTGQAKDISTGLGKVSAAIETVRSASDYAVDSFGTVLKRSEALGGEVRRINASMSEQREGGRQLLEGLSGLKDITGQISSGSGEMSSGNNAILRQISRLNSVNKLVVQNNEQINIGTKEINEAIVATTELSSRTAELIADVKEAADKFEV
jgi:methyl-accepting chemotaxis protein